MRVGNLVGCLFALVSLVRTASLHVHDETFVPDVILRISSLELETACTTRLSTVVNGTSPGPAVVIPAGRTTWIRVYNDQDTQNATVHWHGLTQSVAPFSDGTPLASQWPIAPHHFFDYELHPSLDEVGTYFYHSHVGFQAVSANGPLIVAEHDGRPPVRYHEERYMVLNELYNKTDDVIIGGLLGSPFAWSGEPEAVLVNGHGVAVPNATNSACAPEVFTVEPGKTYRFRMIGAMALTDQTLAFQNHTDRLNVVAADGRYTRPVAVNHLQIDSGQRFDVLLETYSEQVLQKRFNGTRDFWIQIETRYRPTVVTGYALLRYASRDRKPASGAGRGTASPDYEPGTARTASPASLHIPSPIPNITSLLPPVGDNTTNKWLEYALTPLNKAANARFPPASAVTRRIYLSVGQASLPDKQVPSLVNNETWTSEPFNSSYLNTYPLAPKGINPGSPYLVDVYRRGSAALPKIPPGSTHGFSNGSASGTKLYTGYDPAANAYGANVGEVLEIILLNTAGPSGNFDVHPWHAHGGHFYDLGSGPGMYNASANEAQLAHLRATTGFVPALRDTTLLYRFPANNVVNDTFGTVSGWRAWRLPVTDAGVWMVHCHTLQHMVAGMQTVWVMGDAAQITHGAVHEPLQGYETFGGNDAHSGHGRTWGKTEADLSGYLRFGGEAYGNATWAPLVNHHFE